MTKKEQKIWDLALEKAIEVIQEHQDGTKEHDEELDSICSHILEYTREFEASVGIKPSLGDKMIVS